MKSEERRATSGITGILEGLNWIHVKMSGSVNGIGVDYGGDSGFNGDTRNFNELSGEIFVFE